MTVSHLRCHLSDVTAKLRSERELRQRTRELTVVNEQLRLTNRALQELKERYLDLYQNAPAMYFSLDQRGAFLDCNDTLLKALGYRREELVGRSYATVLSEPFRALFPERFAGFLRTGSIELQSRWVKADGGRIDVWVKGSAVRGPDGRVVHSRSIAQDVTARVRLEAELQEKNERLARTIDELSRRNREMDEFTYVVSHDLQEPLRTLTAFSDFLLRDYHDRLGDEGREFVRYIVDASRRMRSLIHDLLTLSRAGKVTGEFEPVNLEELVAVIRADLAELIRSRRAELRVNGPLPVVWGDRDRVGQLLTNLITNGLKYNDKADPHVEVGAPAGGGRGRAPGHPLRPRQRDRHRAAVPLEDLPALPPPAHPRRVRGDRCGAGHL
jgi:PAS domain S-box-containing protein